jgi:predicted ATPase
MEADMLTDFMTHGVTLDGLRGVGRVELRFAPGQRVYTLFGQNGVGKTKCLEALYLLLLSSNKDFVDYIKRADRQDSRDTWDVMTQTHGFPIWDVLKDAQQRIEHSLPIVFLGAASRTGFASSEHSPDVLGSFAERRKKYFNRIREAFLSYRLAALGMSEESRAWFVTRAQSSNPYQKSRDNRQSEIETVLAMLNAIEPRIDAGFLQIDGSGGVFLKVDGEEREFGELSSGFAALLKMIQAIVAGYAAFTNEVQLRNVRGIVLIDEIDAHLHPAWQAKIIACLKSLLPNTTFYIATHSPLVLSQLLNKEAYLIRRDEDGVVRSQTIDAPDRRILDDVLKTAMGVDLNRLKLDSAEHRSQSEAREQLRMFLKKRQEAGV